MQILSGPAPFLGLLLCCVCLASPHPQSQSFSRRHLSKRQAADATVTPGPPDSSGPASTGEATTSFGSEMGLATDSAQTSENQQTLASSALPTRMEATVQTVEGMSLATVSVSAEAEVSSTPSASSTVSSTLPQVPASTGPPRDMQTSSASASVQTLVRTSTSTMDALGVQTSPSASPVGATSVTALPGAAGVSSSTGKSNRMSSTTTVAFEPETSSPQSTSLSGTSYATTAASPAALSTSAVVDSSTTAAVVSVSTESPGGGKAEGKSEASEVLASVKVTDTLKYDAPHGARDQLLTEGANSVTALTEDDPSVNSISSEVNTSSLTSGNSISPLGVTFDHSNSVPLTDTSSVTLTDASSSSVVPSAAAETVVPSTVDSQAASVGSLSTFSSPSAEPSSTGMSFRASTPSASSEPGAGTGVPVTTAGVNSALPTRPGGSGLAEPSPGSELSSSPETGAGESGSASPLPETTAASAVSDGAAVPEPTSAPVPDSNTATPETSATGLPMSTAPSTVPETSTERKATGGSTIAGEMASTPLPESTTFQGWNAGGLVPSSTATTGVNTPAATTLTDTPSPTVVSSLPASTPAGRSPTTSPEPSSTTATQWTFTLVATAEPTPRTQPTSQAMPESSPKPEAGTVPPGNVPASSVEPDPKPESLLPPTPEPETTPEPGGKGAAVVREPFAEPGPDWPVAKKQWSFAWEIHVYLLGGLFALMALYTLASMVCLWKINRLLSRAYFMVLNLLVFCLCTLRAVYLLYDGYNSEGTFHQIVDYFLYSTAFPCLSSVFAILFFALLQATHMRLVPAKIQKISVLTAIILVHFVISIVTDIVVVLFAGMQIMLFVCQLIFILWGLFLFFGYAYIFRRLYTAAVKRQKNFMQYSTGKGARNGPKGTKQKLTLTLAVKVTFVAAIFGLVTVGLEIYGIVEVYGVFSSVKPKPWPWWMYHTALRLTELLMCVTMAYIASQPFRYRQREKGCACCFFCAPCREMCTCQCCRQGRLMEESSGWSENCASLSAFQNGRPAVSKGKVQLTVEEELPVVVQPGDSASADTQPDSLLIIEDGFVRFKADTDINKIVDEAEGHSGIVNTGYRGSVEAQHYMASSGPASTTSYSRKGSLASSGFFRYPSSLSLAESMASEMDRAFTSLHAECKTASTGSLRSLPNGVLPYVQKSPEPTITSFLEQQEPLNEMVKPVLRRSRSAVGSESESADVWWKQKLFRSRSDNDANVRTKEVNNQRYMSLLDLERLKGGGESWGLEEGEDGTNRALPRIVLRKDNSNLSTAETDEIDV